MFLLFFCCRLYALIVGSNVAIVAACVADELNPGMTRPAATQATIVVVVVFY